MAVNPDEDTEFNDALRKHGILPPKPPPPRSPSPPPSPTLEEELDGLTIDELKEREDDAHDSDTERFIASLQRKKLDDERLERRAARFGRVYPVSREDYTREVTDASKQPEEEGSETGTGVVCFLYKDSHIPSERCFEFIRILAPRYPQTKFVSIIGNKCIANYPDRNLPTLILYRNGKLIDNLIAWGANEKAPGTIHHLETVLLSLGIAELSKLSTAAREADRSLDREDSDDEENTKPSGFVGARRRKSAVKKDDSDSDFDL